jgi:putative transport protein
LNPAVTAIIDAFNEVPLAGLLLVISVGYTLSRLTFRGISLGPAGATLFVALLFGHLGFTLGPGANAGARGISLGTLGFALFIYSVGFDAAPHVVASLRDRRGLSFLGVGVVVITIATLATALLAPLTGLSPSGAAGVLAGALTSAPTYAAAAEVASDPARLAVAFAVSYPIGLLTVVLLAQLLPRFGGPDPAQAEPGLDPAESGAGPPEVTRSFEVAEEAATGSPLRELDLTNRTGCVLSRRRIGGLEGPVELPGPDTVLQIGDVVTVTGRVDELRKLEALVGPETVDPGLQGTGLVARRVKITKRDSSGRSLEELGLIHRFRSVVTRIERGRHWIEPDAQVVLARGDVIELVGRREDVRRAAAALGMFEPSLQETDLAVYAGGLFVGIGLGAIRVPVFGIEVGLGFAGGLLLMGLVLGWRQRLGPFRTHVPREARQLVRDLGILLFVGETGIDAGAQLASALSGSFVAMAASGLVVTLLSVALPLLFAVRVLRLSPVHAWGSVAGGLTSSGALHTVRRAADGNEAAISYAAAYGIASVLATLAGPILIAALGRG